MTTRLTSSTTSISSNSLGRDNLEVINDDDLPPGIDVQDEYLTSVDGRAIDLGPVGEMRQALKRATSAVKY